MRWDFSIWRQAEDRWHDIRVAAEEQHRLRQIKETPRSPRLHVIRADLTRAMKSHQVERIRRWLKGAA